MTKYPCPANVIRNTRILLRSPEVRLTHIVARHLNELSFYSILKLGETHDTLITSGHLPMGCDNETGQRFHMSVLLRTSDKVSKENYIRTLIL